ncbi:MAG: hypothetical protein AB1425_01480 [Actinomycetota bacterium]
MAKAFGLSERVVWIEHYEEGARGIEEDPHTFERARRMGAKFGKPKLESARVNRHIGQDLLRPKGEPTSEVEICLHGTNSRKLNGKR